VSEELGSVESVIGRHDAWDPLQSTSSPELHWTTTNAGEAIPGVVTPLCWTSWYAASQEGFEAAGRALGIFTGSNGYDGEAVTIFYGRVALSLEYVATLGDRMPGATGEQAVGGFLGRVPETMTFAPTRRYFGNVMVRLPASFVALPRRLAQLSEAQTPWWRSAVERVGGLDEHGTRTLLQDAFARLDRACGMQIVSTFAAVQPVHDALERVIEHVGAVDASAITAPVGGAEMEVVGDIWRASRGEFEVDEVVRRHGFHGPMEGELSSVVWRERDAPLQRMVEQYAARSDEHSPERLEATRLRDRQLAERGLLDGTTPAQRPLVRLLLELGRRRLHLRGVAKRSMLQAFDATRACSRRLGTHLAAGGRLADPEDVFYLTRDELVGTLPPDASELVALRRERRRIYETLTLPNNWAGEPTPVRIGDAGVADKDATTITGLGVSEGIVEGPARVVTDPGFAEVEPDEILVSPTTDPSWASIMFISAALVVDIGGALSHAAVVARELGIPCVVNTGVGTKAIRTGDLVRVDGEAGTVEILEPNRS
jgi:phosphohistidine swiveling domain-containing protein